MFASVSTHQQMNQSLSWGPQTIAKLDDNSNFTVFLVINNYTVTYYNFV